MACSIYSFEKCLHSLDVMNQTVRVNSQNQLWRELSRDYPVIAEVLDALGKDDNGRCLITRKVVFEEKDNVRKAILALLWGFPKGYRFKSLDTHRDAVKSIIEIAEEDNDRNLTVSMFRAMMSKKDIGLSTLSKILYFFEYKIDGKPALILDSKVRASMNAFQEFEETVGKSAISYEEYVSYVSRMTELSNLMNCVTPDQLELFLFNYQKILS